MPLFQRVVQSVEAAAKSENLRMLSYSESLISVSRPPQKTHMSFKPNVATISTPPEAGVPAPTGASSSPGEVGWKVFRVSREGHDSLPEYWQFLERLPDLCETQVADVVRKITAFLQYNFPSLASTSSSTSNTNTNTNSSSSTSKTKTHENSGVQTSAQ